MASGARAAFIRSVNPRLTYYSKPLLLAIIIGTGTLVTTVALFVILSSSCPTVSTTVEENVFGVTAEHESVFRRRRSQAGTQGRVTTTVDICLKKAREMQVVTHPNYPPSIGVTGVLNYSPCAMHIEELNDFGLSWCVHDGGGESFAVHETRNCDDAHSNGLPTCRQCGDGQGEGDSPVPGPYGVPYMLQTESVTTVQTCPSYVEAVGIALGYAGYVEMILTFLVVGALQLSGGITVVGGKLDENKLRALLHTAGQASVTSNAASSSATEISSKA
jgi:hypothetical protein